MRIAILTSSFPRYPGDHAGAFVYDLARSLVDEGLDVQVLAPHAPDCKTSEVLSGVKVLRFRYFWPTRMQVFAYGAGIPANIRSSCTARLQVFPFTLSFLLNSLRVLGECDVLHAHWIEPGIIGWLGRCLIRTCPLVITLHRYDPPSRIARLASQFILTRADCVFFNSAYTRARCLQDMQIMASEIMPPSIDTKRFHCKWEQYGPSWFNNLKRPLRIFALGVLISRKGFIHLVDAMPAVLEQTDCELIIGGDGPERARILERASQLGIADRVHLLGKVSTDEVPRLMCEADVFVLPSVPESSGYNETLGVVLLEALASGTPCVASRTGGIPDAVEDGVDGYLVTPGDSNELATCIIRLLRDEDLRERMGRAGRQKVEQRFSLQPIVRRTIAVYEQLLL